MGDEARKCKSPAKSGRVGISVNTRYMYTTVTTIIIVNTWSFIFSLFSLRVDKIAEDFLPKRQKVCVNSQVKSSQDNFYLNSHRIIIINTNLCFKI